MSKDKRNLLSHIPLCECGSTFKMHEIGLTCKAVGDGTYKCVQCDSVFKFPDGRSFTDKDIVGIDKLLGGSS